MREQASWGFPPSPARTQDWDLSPAPPFSAPGSSPPLPPPPTSQSLREAGERVIVSCCQLRSVLLGTVGKSIYKLLPLWTSDPAGAQEIRQQPSQTPAHRAERLGRGHAGCWGSRGVASPRESGTALPRSQWVPSCPGLQTHRYPATRSWQEPPCRHGWDRHSSISEQGKPGCQAPGDTPRIEQCCCC